ncbi:adhesion G-protein coupled receptor G2-like isoform X2 [Maniola jurtina]|uniref:adhesion G-protein coupled receptor G2-like isoform X2 n=1 Tax=Maniola jurtina TaxID=191418 RepID=UPI001E68A7C4|nr:adhesion G-protein coupled receptor G2-like isoform X2 [Maniola jurtina]
MFRKMQYVVRAAILFVLWIPTLTAQGKEITNPLPSCPIGFTLIYKKDKYTPFCVRRKGPETFTELYKDCVGNLYTTKLYQELNISKPDYAVWTEYKTLYSGGVFIDWSHTRTTGDQFKSDDVVLDPMLDVDGDLCLIMDPVSNFTAVKCHTNHYRFCVVKPYVKEGMTKKGCEGLKDSFRFWSPVSTCLTVLTGVGGGAVRATWNQARDLCGKKGGYLLSHGWRYSNYKEFSYANNLNHTYPLGIVMSTNYSWLRYDAMTDHSEIPISEWNFGDTINTTDTFLGALRYNFWYLVNGSYIFYDVICERSVQIKDVSLDVTIDVENKLTLAVNDSLDKDDIYCFTDSVYYYPVKVKKERVDDSNVYVLKPKQDGYYWCTHVNTKRFKVTESKKVLFIREKVSLVNLYTIKLRYLKMYSIIEDLEKLYSILGMRLKEYIYLRTKYESVYGDLNTNITEEVLKSFQSTNYGLDWKENSVIVKMKIKRLYLDRGTILIHVELHPDMRPVTPGIWEDIVILSMKPVFYCKGFDSIPQMSLGQSTKSVGCRTHTCVGDFNEGVQWVTTATADCSTRSPVTLDRSLQFLPTQISNPETPGEQLDQVLSDLDNLINSSAPITVDDIGDVFNQVDELFEHHDSLEIPGRLLHLLDNLGAAIELNGSRSVTTVRNNIAMLLADAEPSHPVRGMKIAARDNDVFTDGAFEIISGEVNRTVLDSERNEVVVHLPQSVSDASRRISFVVFRNDRAFQASQKSYSVNSRVLSIKVEDVTNFENGEVIDIHLSPTTTETDRNATRTCAYWKFNEDGTGSWSSDGCTLIRATEPGMLDTCRCTHLTHFAEVLFPKSVFSQKDEDVLELLTVIGCCLSIFGLIMVGVTAAMFRSWRRDYSNKIWLQLCISIFLLVLSFLVIIFAKFDQYSIACMLIGVVLHYSVLSSFCWMLVAAVLSYRRLVLVFTRDASHKLLRASAFAWGVPLAIIGILLSAAPSSYAGRFEEKMPSGSFCYPSGLAMWLAVYAPIAFILLVNWTLFALIVRSVFASRGIQRHGDSNEALRCASVSCLLVFLFGLPWIFGLFAFNVVAAYFFTFTATYQGFMLFLFFVLGNKKTRDLWLNKLKIKQTRKVPVTSSTYSNSRTGWRGAASPLSVEAKASKPKSLNQDDSRFS